MFDIGNISRYLFLVSEETKMEYNYICTIDIVYKSIVQILVLALNYVKKMEGMTWKIIMM